MPRYYFDIHDGDRLLQDDQGVELNDRLEAGTAAIAKLRRVGASCLPDEDMRRAFVVYVRGERRQEPLLKASLNFAFQWLDT